MNTHVIILAQGEQKRLPNLVAPKQMLPLPACGDVPILYRTLAQVARLCPELTPLTWDKGWQVSVVCWLPLSEEIMRASLPPQIVRDRAMSIETATLPQPGNSSLKGLARYLTQRAAAGYDEPGRTIVLLGDVVYSWACLRELFAEAKSRFVGTSDISESGGELWGFAWTRGTAARSIHECIVRALNRHPSFQAYQPGQLRRVLWETMAPSVAGLTATDWKGVVADMAENGATALPWYRAIDDYTRDIDLPKHVEEIGALSIAARDDDAQNGLAW